MFVANANKLITLVIPVYSPTLSDLDLFSLKYSIQVLCKKHDISFICPQSLDINFYSTLFPNAKFIAFDDCYFYSVSNYSQLLLSESFYKKFESYEFILITQTDAIILRDELDFWCSQKYDYIGAPWPNALSIVVNTDQYKGQNKRVRCSVGNGGLSLRRVKKLIELLKEFPEAAGNLANAGINEDLFFSAFGSLSGDFSIPDRITASKFSMEISVEYFYHLNGGYAPMGGHAWWRYHAKFWLDLLGSYADTIRESALKAHAVELTKINAIENSTAESRAKWAIAELTKMKEVENQHEIND
ncbi:MAG: hypothetical protein FWG12_04570 [Holophagaceae bacterium]|nr:hypothetical protein [Holophagaceae bacterium]